MHFIKYKMDHKFLLIYNNYFLLYEKKRSKINNLIYLVFIV